jgi:hypothetical protein
MRELSAFDQREVRRMVARHLIIRAGFLKEGDELKLPKVDRELWELGYDMSHDLAKVVLR